MFVGFNRAFRSFMERKEDKYIVWELLRSFESIMDFTKTIPSLVRLIASIVFNNLFGVEIEVN